MHAVVRFAGKVLKLKMSLLALKEKRRLIYILVWAHTVSHWNRPNVVIRRSPCHAVAANHVISAISHKREHGEPHN